MAVSKSVVMGFEALQTPAAVTESVIIGPAAGKHHLRGERNIFVGRSAGQAAEGSGNIYIGTNAGSGANGSGNLFLGEGVTDQVASNTLIIGRGAVRPIVASLETGKVTVPQLQVEGDLVYKGTLKGLLPSNVVRTVQTNVGTAHSYTGTHLVSFGEQAGTSGGYNVFLGAEAGKEARLDRSVAIGELAAAHATGSNVIAIGHRAGYGQFKSDSLYIGSFLEGDSRQLQIHRDLAAGGWKLSPNALSSRAVSLTPSNLQMGSASIAVTRDTTLQTSTPLHVRSAPALSDGLLLVQADGSLLANGRRLRSAFRTLFAWMGGYVGLDTTGHVYRSQNGTHWFPIRSPKLDHLSFIGPELVGWGGGNFYGYSLDGEWHVEPRDAGDGYTCTGLSGAYAFGTPLSNDFYEDRGTLLFRTGREWRLYPGVYPDAYTHAVDAPDGVYVGTATGLYKLENRAATLLRSISVTALQGSYVATGRELQTLRGDSIVQFTTDIVALTDDGLVVTQDGIYTSDGRLVQSCLGATHAIVTPAVQPTIPDISAPETAQIGRYLLRSTDRGLSITNGVYEGVLHDSTLNPIPIRLDGIASLTVKKSSDGGLIFVSVDSATGDVLTHTLEAPQSTRLSP